MSRAAETLLFLKWIPTGSGAADEASDDAGRGALRQWRHQLALAWPCNADIQFLYIQDVVSLDRFTRL